MGLAAIGAALELPDDGEPLSGLARCLVVVGQLEQAVEEPGLPVEAIVREHGLCSTRFDRRERDHHRRAGANQTPASGDHGITSGFQCSSTLFRPVYSEAAAAKIVRPARSTTAI